MAESCPGGSARDLTLSGIAGQYLKRLEQVRGMNKVGKLALVTGANGFLGSNLVAALTDRGYHVRALHRRTSNLTALAGLTYEDAVGDLTDATSLRQAMEGCEIVFHVAAVADYWRTPLEMIYQVNVEGTRNVVRAAVAAGGVRRLVFTSSVAALGVPPGGKLLDEQSQFNLSPNRFPYGHSKALAERVARQEAGDGLELVIVNPSVILGPRDIHFISGSIIKEIYQRRVPICPPGGTNYIAVESVVAGEIAAAEMGRPGQRYVLGGVNLSYSDTFRTVARVLNVPFRCRRLPARLYPLLGGAVDLYNRIGVGPRLVDGNQVRLSVFDLYIDASLAEQELDLPSTDFEATVQETFQWYKEQGLL